MRTMLSAVLSGAVAATVVAGVVPASDAAPAATPAARAVAPAATASTAAYSATEPGTYVPVTPARIMDTRTSPVKGAPAPPARGVTHLPVAGHGGVPASGAAAVVVDIDAAYPKAGGYLTAYADTAARPNVASLSYAAGAIVANQVVVPLGSNGRIALYNGSSAALPTVVDVLGYYRAGAATTPGSFSAVPPARLVDTRTSTTTPSPAARGTAVVPVLGRAGIPANGVSAIAVTVTAITPAAAGYVTVYAGPDTRPGTSNVQFQPKRTVTTGVVTQVGSDGRIRLYNGSTSRLGMQVDVEGYFRSGTPTQPGAYVPVAPQRIMDTRYGLGPSTPNSRSVAQVPVAGEGGVPSHDVEAAQLNVVVAGPAKRGYLTAYPSGTSRPDTSNISFPASVKTANAVTAGLGTNGAVAMFNGALSPAPLIADVFGYYIAPDVTAPGPVTDVSAAPSSTTVTLVWTNPGDADFAGVAIRRALGATPPSSATDGEFVADTASTRRTYTDTTVAPGTAYSYALFAHDEVPNYATAATITTRTTRDPSCTTTWTGAVSTNWSDGGNWSKQATPTPSDYACIPGQATNTPVVLADTVSVLGLNNGGGLQLTGSLSLTDPQRTSSSSARLVASGTLAVASTLVTTGPTVVSGLTLRGPGTLDLQAGTSVSAAGNTTGDTACRGSLWITGGASVLSESTLSLDAGAAVGIDTDGSLLTNRGTTQLRDGSVLGSACTTPTAATLVNAANATISVPTGAARIPAWWRNAGTVTVSSGAALLADVVTEATNTGFVTGSGVTTLSGRLVAADGASAAVVGGVTLDDIEVDGPTGIGLTGTVVVAAGTSGCAGDVRLTDDAAVSVTGTLSFAPGAVLGIDTDGSQLTNHGTVQLRDAAALGAACATPTSVTLVNATDGTVSVPSGSARIPAWWRNAGTVTVAAGAALAAGAVTEATDTGTITGSGTTTLSGRLLAAAGSSAATLGGVTLGTLEIDGPAPLTLTGAVAVAAGSTGCAGSVRLTDGAAVSVTGTLSFAAGAVLGIDTDGSQLTNRGTVQLRDASVLGSACAAPGAATFTNDAAGTVTVPSGRAVISGWWQDRGTATVASGASLSLAARTDVVSGASFKGAGRTDLDGTFVVPAGVSVPMTNLAGTGELRLTGSSGLGAISASGAYSIGALALSMPDLTPTCGTTVTAISGGTESGTWRAITSGTGAAGGAWVDSSTATTAAATYTC